MRLFSRKRNASLQAKAETLVMAARANALMAYQTSAERLELVNSIPVARWEFLVTIGSAVIAAVRAEQIGLSETDRRSLMGVVAHHLQEWRGESAATTKECTAYFERMYVDLARSRSGDQLGFVSADAIGSWIVESAVGHGPTSDQERGLVRVVGSLIMAAFYNWWPET